MVWQLQNSKTEVGAPAVRHLELFPQGEHPEITVSAGLDTTELTKANFGMIFFQLTNIRWYRLKELCLLKLQCSINSYVLPSHISK